MAGFRCRGRAFEASAAGWSGSASPAGDGRRGSRLRWARRVRRGGAPERWTRRTSGRCPVACAGAGAAVPGPGGPGSGGYLSRGRARWVPGNRLSPIRGWPFRSVRRQAVKCGHIRLERDVNDPPERQPSSERARARAHACLTRRAGLVLIAVDGAGELDHRGEDGGGHGAYAGQQRGFVVLPLSLLPCWLLCGMPAAAPLTGNPQCLAGRDLNGGPTKMRLR